MPFISVMLFIPAVLSKKRLQGRKSLFTQNIRQDEDGLRKLLNPNLVPADTLEPRAHQVETNLVPDSSTWLCSPLSSDCRTCLRMSDADYLYDHSRLAAET